MENDSSRRDRFNGETSLVDLAVILARRWRLIVSVFAVVTFSGTLYSVIVPPQYEFVSLVQVAKTSTSEPLEPPAALVATLKSQWWPDAQASYRSKVGAGLPFDITFENPPNTALLRLSSEASQESEELVSRIHKRLIEQVLGKQNALLREYETGLDVRLNALNGALSELQGGVGNEAAAAIATLYESKAEIELKRQALMGPEIITEARRIADLGTPATSLIVVLSAILGATLGIFSALFSVFVGHVRDALSGDLRD